MTTKKILCILTLGLLILTSCTKEDNNQGILISKEQALKIVEPITSQHPERFVVIRTEPLKARAIVRYSEYGGEDEEIHKTKAPNFKSWLIVQDGDININGGKLRQHFFVNVTTGEFESVFLPGIAIAEWDESFMTLLGDTSSSSTAVATTKTSSDTGQDNSNKWAVIISGGKNKESNYARYWNDCQYIYSTLTQYLDYPENQIYCLISDGTSPADDRNIGNSSYDSSPLDLDGDGDNDVQYSATKSNISTVFNLLSSQISRNDEVLVFITDHGSSHGILLWGSGTLSPTELKTELSKISAAKIDIVMGQCYSGAFISPLASYNRTIATACSSSESSMGNGYLYDYFLKTWTDALIVEASGKDSNSDGYLSPYEIFNYATVNDIAAVQGYEHPQYSSTPSIYGYAHDLNGFEFWPILSGSEYVSTEYTMSYSFTGLPSSTQITWSVSSGLTITSSSNSSVSVKGNILSGYVLTGETITASYTLEGMPFSTTFLVSSVWKPGEYTGYITGNNGNYMTTQYPGAYNYYWFSSNPAWQILSHGSFQVQVEEGYTTDPVDLSVCFFDPLGQTIVLTARVKN